MITKAQRIDYVEQLMAVAEALDSDAQDMLLRAASIIADLGDQIDSADDFRSLMSASVRMMLVEIISQGEQEYEAAPLAKREIDAVASSIALFHKGRVTERDILTERLTRRYDPGMALNEATIRAQEKMREAKKDFVELTEKQKMAMRTQQELLRNALRNA